MADERTAADRWYRRYLELQRDKESGQARAAQPTTVDARLRDVVRRLERLDVPVYGNSRGVSYSGKQALLVKYTRRLNEAEQRVAQQVLRSATRVSPSRQQAEGRASRELARRLERDQAYAVELVRKVRLDEGIISAEETAELLRAALRTPTVTVGDTNGVFYVDPTLPLDTSVGRDGRGRRPLPAIARERVVEIINCNAYPCSSDLEVRDVDGSVVYVHADALGELVQAGKVDGFAKLTEAEAEELHQVLLQTEHYQRLLLRQAIVEGDHDPADVLALSHREKVQAQYRVRLGLPVHKYREECCGPELAAPVKEATE